MLQAITVVDNQSTTLVPYSSGYSHTDTVNTDDAFTSISIMFVTLLTISLFIAKIHTRERTRRVSHHGREDAGYKLLDTLELARDEATLHI